MVKTVTIRKVAGADLYESGLFDKLTSEGEILPNPLLTVAWMAVDEDDKIVGHAVVHSLPVVEYVHAESGEIIKELFGHVESFIRESGAPRVLAHTEHRAMARMLTRVGFGVPSPWFEWTKE